MIPTRRISMIFGQREEHDLEWLSTFYSEVKWQQSPSVQPIL